MIPCTKLSIKMQVKKATNFYKFSLDKNRVGNCDLFSRPVFMTPKGTSINDLGQVGESKKDPKNWTLQVKNCW